MSSGDAVFRWIQSVARSTAAKSGTGAPRQEYLIRHTLESFLDQLSRTSHAGNCVLKGGILLAAYGVRRPRKDADSNAVNADITTENLAQVVRDIAAVPRAILERGITSTRWRDYVDIVELARHGIDDNEPLRSARAVARHAGSLSNPSHHTWLVTAQSHRRNGRHGAERSTSNLSARSASTTRSPWSRLASIRSSSRAPNQRIRNQPRAW